MKIHIKNKLTTDTDKISFYIFLDVQQHIINIFLDEYLINMVEQTLL